MIGIALGPGRLVAALPRGRRLETTEVMDLSRAFVELREATQLKRATVSIALVPPLVQVRHLSLPPLSPDERRRVIARDVGRYFVDVREPQVVGSDAFFAAAAPAALIDAIEAGVAAVGWTLASVVPAHAAWAALGDGVSVVRLPDATEVLRIERGNVVERRRLPAGDPASADTVVDDPWTAAAEQVHRVSGPDLRSERGHALRRRRGRQVAAALAGLAVVGLILAAGIDYWSMGRELRAVRERRAAVAPQVAAAMRARDSLGVLTGRLTRLASLEATAPHWSAFLTDLADFLPREAHVVALRGRGDSVSVEGIAGRAGEVFQALQQMPHVAAVRAEAPIRQDVAPDGTVRELFALSVRLRTP